MIPVAWRGSIDRRSGRCRSRFLYRRVEARATCYGLFALDALHVLQDAEELRSALRVNYEHEQDAEKLRLRLSTRQKKKQRKGKELPLRQALLLSAFPSDVVSSKEKTKTGFDLIQTLKEVLEIMTS